MYFYHTIIGVVWTQWLTHDQPDTNTHSAAWQHCRRFTTTQVQGSFYWPSKCPRKLLTTIEFFLNSRIITAPVTTQITAHQSSADHPPDTPTWFAWNHHRALNLRGYSSGQSHRLPNFTVSKAEEVIIKSVTTLCQTAHRGTRPTVEITGQWNTESLYQNERYILNPVWNPPMRFLRCMFPLVFVSLTASYTTISVELCEGGGHWPMDGLMQNFYMWGCSKLLLLVYNLTSVCVLLHQPWMDANRYGLRCVTAPHTRHLGWSVECDEGPHHYSSSVWSLWCLSNTQDSICN